MRLSLKNETTTNTNGNRERQRKKRQTTRKKETKKLEALLLINSNFSSHFRVCINGLSQILQSGNKRLYTC